MGEKHLKKSQLNASDESDYDYLMRNAFGLIPCWIEVENEDIIFHFQMEGLRPFCELKQENLEYRFRFLQNLSIYGRYGKNIDFQ